MGAAVVSLRPRVIYRTRCPVTAADPETGVERYGYGDIWTTDKARADARAEATPGAFVETLTEADIFEFEPAAQLKGRAAWARAFPE